MTKPIRRTRIQAPAPETMHAYNALAIFFKLQAEPYGAGDLQDLRTLRGETSKAPRRGLVYASLSPEAASLPRSVTTS